MVTASSNCEIPTGPGVRRAGSSATVSVGSTRPDVGLGIELEADGDLDHGCKDLRPVGIVGDLGASQRRTACSEPMQPASSKRRVKSIVNYPARDWRPSTVAATWGRCRVSGKRTFDGAVRVPR